MVHSGQGIIEKFGNLTTVCKALGRQENIYIGFKSWKGRGMKFVIA